MALARPAREFFTCSFSGKSSYRPETIASEPGGILIYTGQPWHPQ
ncbi:class I SAM-dependent methyltransferase family protein, partial [Bacillus sp. SS-TM]